MNKKQILSTILAGLITINALGGCSKQNSNQNNLESSISETIDESQPKVDKIPANIVGLEVKKGESTEGNIYITSIKNEYKNENEDYITIGDTSYKVELIITKKYPATKVEKDGVIEYYAIEGGTVVDGIATAEYTKELKEEDKLKILVYLQYVTEEEVQDYKNESKLTRAL